jgi:hypothetical protein
MTPKGLHMICDFFLIFPFFCIIFSIFFFSNSLEKEIFIINDLFASWKKKPIDSLQESYGKTCDKIGMNDLVSYEWPGTTTACHCEKQNNQAILSNQGKCNEKELQIGCRNVDEIKPFRARKWKTRYLCSSSTKTKSYFEINKVKRHENCVYKYKKCGVIDTLDNFLCIPENEICPLNMISFLNTVDEQNVRIDTSNIKVENGKIYSNFMVAEKNLCVNHVEREFFEKNYLLTNFTGKYLKGCETQVGVSGEIINFDKNFDKIDSYPKKLFYENNKIFPFVLEKLPLYPNNISSDLALYASTFVGWKRECDKKEFNSFKNGNYQKEIDDIVQSFEDYNFPIKICASILLGLYILGIILFKYSQITQNNNKIEITSKMLLFLSFFYAIVLCLNVVLFYISDISLEVIKTAKLSSEFFEFLTNNNCSDEFTNSVLNHLTKEFFSYANRYFNIKIISTLSILISCSMIFITIFLKTSDSKNSRRRPYFKTD